KTAVWRQADAAMRAISGDWPMPEPDASAAPIPPGSPQDREDRQSLGKTWGDWWNTNSTPTDGLPQVRVELTWNTPAARPAGVQTSTLDAALTMLWVRPTGSVHLSRLLGLAQSADAPIWKWDHRNRRQFELHLNAIQADAARAIAAGVLDAETSTTWAIDRPVGLPSNWHGRLSVLSPFGQPKTVELTEAGAPGAVRPPPAAADAMSDLLNVMNNP
ncbi:MAG: hypothetical protein PHU85_19425, partial [Phycisphaerae bacterium]|nr:hypothetical protein [Phycisphaerae bacterium]